MLVRRGFVVMVSALTLVLVASGTANARETVARDGRGDVWRSDSPAQADPSPRTRNGDVVRTWFRHGRHNVVITSRYVDLARVGRYAQYASHLQTGSRVFREVRVETGPRSWRGRIRVFDGRGNLVPCRATHRIRYDANTVRILVPRSCLGTARLGPPRQVRANAVNHWADRSGTFFTDNPHNRRASVRGWTRWIRTG